MPVGKFAGIDECRPDPFAAIVRIAADAVPSPRFYKCVTQRSLGGPVREIDLPQRFAEKRNLASALLCVLCGVFRI